MTRSTTTFLKIVLTCLIPLFYTCHTAKHKSIETPDSGEFCYKADSGSEYIRMTLNNGKVTGKILNQGEDEKLIQNFTGTVVPESNKAAAAEIQVSVSYVDSENDYTWVIWFEEDGMQLKYGANAMEFTHYSKVPCDSVTAILERLDETILTYKSTGFKLPKGTPVCYQSVSANAYKRNDVYEYFQLWNNDGKIKGRGAGYSLGDPVWDFDFHGSIENNTMNVTINYRKKGEEPHSALEKWTIDPKENRISIKDYKQSVMSAREYVDTDNEAFYNFVHSYFEKKDLTR